MIPVEIKGYPRFGSLSKAIEFLIIEGKHTRKNLNDIISNFTNRKNASQQIAYVSNKVIKKKYPLYDVIIDGYPPFKTYKEAVLYLNSECNYSYKDILDIMKKYNDNPYHLMSSLKKYLK
jgi:hypothetical protein